MNLEQGERTHRVLRLGICVSVDGIGPVNWLFFKFLYLNDKNKGQVTRIKIGVYFAADKNIAWLQLTTTRAALV